MLGSSQLTSNLDIYAYAIGSFNEPACANINLGSNVTTAGPWTIAPSAQSSSEYLSATFNSPNINSGSASVVFLPDIKQSGNYSVTIYTPGCTQDNTCATRGRVNITGSMSSNTQSGQPLQTEVTQTNNFDKYDRIYNGYVASNSDSFRPSITLTPSSGQSSGLTVVAQRVRFELSSSTGGLNGIYEFNPNVAVSGTDFSNSTIDEAGMNLGSGALVNSVVIQNSTTYVGGNFSTKDFSNIFAISSGNSTSLPGGGLNAEVLTMYLNGTSLFVGGNFTNTSNTNTQGLNNVALFSISNNSWVPLGAGVNGPVEEIVPILFNVTANDPENVIALTGDFTQVNGFGNNAAAPVAGLAIWVPSKQNWLQVFGSQAPSIQGQLNAALGVPNGTNLYAGTLSYGQTANDAVSLATSGALAINGLPINIQPQSAQQPMKRKRDVSGQNVTGVVTGYFYVNGGRNVTILGGHFSAQATNGSTIHNLLFINGTSNNQVTGLGPGLGDDAVFQALAVQQDTLYAGGTLSGTVNGASVNGLILYDLIEGQLVQTQPPAFTGTDVSVNAIATQPNTGNVYVAGSFDSAGSLDCPTVCFFTTSTSQWNRPGTGLSGSVGAMAWSQSTKLVVGGNLTVNNTATYMAMYDSKARSWSMVPGANALPGPVTALSPANDEVSEFWAAGASTNGSAFLMKYDGSSWKSIGDTLGNLTRIRGIQVLALSKNHAQTNLVDDDQILLVTGELDLPNFGNSSSALFNGTTFTPFILSNSGNSPGSLSQIFAQNPITLKPSGMRPVILHPSSSLTYSVHRWSFGCWLCRFNRARHFSRPHLHPRRRRYHRRAHTEKERGICAGSNGNVRQEQ